MTGQVPLRYSKRNRREWRLGSAATASVVQKNGGADNDLRIASAIESSVRDITTRYALGRTAEVYKDLQP
jgi:hypothetical protein